MDNGSKAVLGCLGMLVGVPLLFLFGVLVTGFVVKEMWEWFVVPLGVMPINLWHAAGFACLWSFMCPPVDLSELQKKDQEHQVAAVVGKMIGYLVVRPLVVLLIGFIASRMM